MGETRCPKFGPESSGNLQGHRKRDVAQLLEYLGIVGDGPPLITCQPGKAWTPQRALSASSRCHTPDILQILRYPDALAKRGNVRSRTIAPACAPHPANGVWKSSQRWFSPRCSSFSPWVRQRVHKGFAKALQKLFKVSKRSTRQGAQRPNSQWNFALRLLGSPWFIRWIPSLFPKRSAKQLRQKGCATAAKFPLGQANLRRRSRRCQRRNNKQLPQI